MLVAGLRGRDGPGSSTSTSYHSGLIASRAAPAATRVATSDLAASNASVLRSRPAPTHFHRQIETLGNAWLVDGLARSGGWLVQARVDAGRVPGVLGEPSQNSDKPGAFAGVERGEDLGLVLVSDSASAG